MLAKLTNTLRHRAGLLWGVRPAPHLKIINRILLAVLALNFLGYLQERDAADIERARAASAVRAQDKAERALLNCLNGNAAFPIEGEFKAVWCDRATLQTL